jgi:hypothetical protein
MREIARSLDRFRGHVSVQIVMHRATCVNLKDSYHFRFGGAPLEDAFSFCIT